MRDRYEHWLQILMVVSGFVLLIVCANVANLMLVRGMERRRQTSLAMALGARTGRLMREPLLESLCLSLLGGVAGLAIAFEGTRLILRFAFPAMSGLAGVPISRSDGDPSHRHSFLAAHRVASQENAGSASGCAFAGVALGCGFAHRGVAGA
jgi:hypothetical protein